MTKTIFYILLYALFNVAGAALIKLQLKGRSLVSLTDWLGLINLPFIAAFGLIIISALTLFKALSINQFSLIIPIATGINFMLTILVGYYLFNDKLSFLSFVGFLLIIGGILILSLTNYSNA